MKLLKDIVFRPESGTSGLCDLYLPDRVSKADLAALTIHGGGWNSMTKENFEGVARWLCEDLGMPVCNANYRLSCEAPWPACGDDCLTAAKFLLADTRIPGDPARRKLFVVGGSSGGHLALMTGLRLPPEKIAGAVSISGIADLGSSTGRYAVLFGHEPDETEIRAASPSTYLTPDSPPILCTHEHNDNVVPIRASQDFLDAVRRNGTVGESFFYDKPETGYSHRIWIPGSAPHRLYPEIEAAVAAFIAQCIDKNK